MKKISLADKLAQFSDHWNPRIVGEVNDMHVKVVKLLGAFDWHHHATEDELFLVLQGRLTMRLHNRDIVVGPGEFVIVPHGVEHKPMSDEEVHLLLIEPNTTLNTGNVRSERTRTELERL